MHAARAYVRAIRNTEKRRYAEAYLAFLTGGAEPDKAEYRLSYMAMQAVRLGLAQLDQTGSLTRR
jgi:hypothetical protein